MYRIINGTVSAEAVKLETDVAGAAGSHDDVVLRLKFDEIWDDLSITALWINSRGENPVYTLVSPLDGMADILIPAEPKAYPGECVFCLKGVVVESTIETRATVTVSTKMRVLPSLYAEDAQFPEDITSTLFNQLRAEFSGEIGDLDDLLTTYKDDIVGAINEVAQGAGFTGDYNDLTNKPSIGGVEVKGSKTLAQFGMEEVANKVTSITNSSTNTQYPSAKAVYDLVIGAMGGEY